MNEEKAYEVTFKVKVVATTKDGAINEALHYLEKGTNYETSVIEE